MLDFRIDTFLATCKYMNYTRAAQELNITQPAVSQHIRHLEKEYKIELFSYQAKKLQLTDAGQQFLKVARTMKNDDEVLKDSLTKLSSGQEKITIGATKTAGQFLLAKPLSKYLLKNPATTISFVMENTEELFKKLNDGLIDCALIEESFEKREYDYLIYSKERYIAVCKTDYPFAQKPRKIDDLLDERLLIREEGSGSREILERFLKGKNLSIKDFSKACEVNNINAIKSLVSAGIGVTFIYEFAVRKALKQKKMLCLELEDFEIAHDIIFVWRRDSVFAEYYKMLFAQLCV